MSMLNLDGQIVASALLSQQSGDLARELVETRNAAKVYQGWEQQLYSLQRDYDCLVVKYNSVVDRYNDMLADNRRADAANSAALAEKDRQIQQLTVQRDIQAAEREDSRKSASEGWIKLTRALEEIERLRNGVGEALPNEN